MIGILYPLKMTKNLSEAYSAIYEISADLAIKAAKGAEKKRAESAKAGDTEGAKKAMGQNKKFFDYAKGKRQKENMPKKPTGPMANKPSPDPTSSYPGTPQVMKQGKIVKSSYEPEGEIVEGDTKAMKKYLDDKAKKLTKKRDAQSDAYKNNPAFDSTSPNPKYEGVLHRVKEIVKEFKNYDEGPDEKGNIPKGSTGSGKYSMSKKDYKKTHKDFKSDDPKNPRISHYDKGTKSSPVKFVEHHQKDENGKVIEHEDTTPSSVEEGLKQARKNVGASKCWDGKKIGSPPTKTKNGKEVPNCVPEEIIKSTTFVISETPKGDAGKDRATKVKDRSARSYGGSDTYGAKYNAPIRRTLHDMKRGVKKDKGHVNRPNKPTSKFDDDRQGGAHWHNQGQGLAGTKKHGKSDYAEPSRKKVKKENYSWRERMEEGMATPESGTGKYYVQGKPTAMQLKKRAEMEKVKKYGSVEAHDKKMNK